MEFSANGRKDVRKGSVLVVTVIMLVVAAITVGSILAATSTYAKFSEATYGREKAAFLADGGLQAAIIELNRQGDGNIGTNESRAWFTRTNGFINSDWSFATRRTGFHLTSTGRYRGHEVTVQCDLYTNNTSGYIHAIYMHALYAGNSSGDTNYVLKIGGTGTGADYVNGNTYSGRKLELSGDAKLRLPELMNDKNGDGICDPATDTWSNAYATQVFSNALSQAAYNTYTNSQKANAGKFYNNGKYDFGEAYVDTIGNGHYDLGEPFVDVNGNGVWDPGDTFIDRDGDGVYDAGVDTVVDKGNGRWDAGEEWTEDSSHSQRVNGRYDPAGGYWKLSYNTWSWKTTYTSGGKTYSCASWPAEQFEDLGDGVFSPAEPYTDQNGHYDVGEQFFDDRNDRYDYGTQAPGTITGMPAPGPGQRAATGGDAAISPPDLVHMYYELQKSGTNAVSPPDDALERWGHDVAVTASQYTSAGGNGKVIANVNNPCHMFIRNVNQSRPGYGNDDSAKRETLGGVTIRSREYNIVTNQLGQRVDDYFLEDPTDSTYNTIPGESLAIAQNDSDRTHTILVNVTDDQNNKLYYVDGNVFIHATPTYALRFKNPGTRITIVARGNITISDEFYYNADYPTNLQYSSVNSTVVKNPSDALCLIALTNSASANSGNIYIGDTAYGTGGAIHAMLYAQNDFVDNNINTVDQQFISIFGNMTAGDQVRVNRTTGGGSYRTRLDITLDERIMNGVLIDGDPIVPGLPHPVGNQRYVKGPVAGWEMIPGSWSSAAMLK